MAESPVPHHLVFGVRAKGCVAQHCSHEGCKGRPSSDCLEAHFRDGHPWERQTNGEAPVWSSSLGSSPKTPLDNKTEVSIALIPAQEELVTS